MSKDKDFSPECPPLHCRSTESTQNIQKFSKPTKKKKEQIDLLQQSITRIDRATQYLSRLKKQFVFVQNNYCQFIIGIPAKGGCLATFPFQQCKANSILYVKSHIKQHLQSGTSITITQPQRSEQINMSG